jgi:hypothetical protein
MLPMVVNNQDEENKFRFSPPSPKQGMEIEKLESSEEKKRAMQLGASLKRARINRICYQKILGRI